jgi:predicted MFS family arabinose efflux permease
MVGLVDRGGFVGVLGAATAGYLCYQGLVVMVPYALLQRGTSNMVVGLSTFVFMVSATLIPFAVISRMHGISLTSVLILCALTVGAPAALEINGETFAVLAGAVIRGAAFGVLSLVTAVAVVKLAPPDRTGAWLGIYGFATSIAAIVGQPLGLELLARYGARTAALILAVVPLLGVAPFAVSKRLRTCASIVEEPHGERGIRTSPNLVLVPIIGIAAVTAVLGVVVTFGGAVVDRSGSVTPSVFFFLMGISIPVGRLVAGYAADRGARTLTAYVLPQLAVATALGSMVFDGLVPVAVIAPVILGLGTGMSISSGQIDLVRKRLFSSVHRASAWFGAAWNIPMGIGALLAGLAGSFWSQRSVVIACCALPIAGAAAIHWLGQATGPPTAGGSRSGHTAAGSSVDITSTRS